LLVMSARLQKSAINPYEGGWENRLRHNDSVSPNRGPESYRFTPEHPKLLRSPPPSSASPQHSEATQLQQDTTLMSSRLRAEVKALRERAHQLGEEGEEMRHAVHEQQVTLDDLTATAREHEDALNAASLKQQEAEEDLMVLQPKHDLIQQEHTRVQTTIADLRLEATELEEEASRAADAEEALVDLMQNVVHRSTADLMEHEKELDIQLKQLEPQLTAANKARSAARQELQKVRSRIKGWTSGQGGSSSVDVQSLTPQQQQQMRAMEEAMGASRSSAPSITSDVGIRMPRENDREDFNDSMQNKFARTFGSPRGNK